MARRNAAIHLLGALASYGSVTNNQAATFTNQPSLADPRSDLIANLFAAGLIDIASPYLGQGLGAARDGTVGYQLGDLNIVRRLIQQLSVAEAVAITGGRPLPTNAVHVRHDTLGAELALRAAGHLKIGTVLGPHLSSFADLTAMCRYPSAGRGGPDLTLVRDDGLRVAIEITSSIGEKFTAKVERWMQVLAESPLETSGLTVVFLVAPPPAAVLRHGDRVRRTVYREVGKAVRTFPGSSRDRTANRVGVATWREWFPRPHLATERFGWLEVDRPNGEASQWTRCRMWDPRQRPLADDTRVALRSVISAASILSQTPFWLRERHSPAVLSADLLRSAVGVPQDVDPLRDRSARRPTGASQGVAGATCLPAYLIGPADSPERAARQRVTSPIGVTPPPLPDPAFGHKLERPEERRA
ncbi:hypothetical protein ASC77_18630 [Nocardioides sp. Root1257]|nr:hypothetical protein ASC77_18630 [Nocardioides sp. Root1257]KRC43197.1 hypothetical protein ASE24_19595 [Nocardioides sp. Root224]